MSGQRPGHQELERVVHFTCYQCHTITRVNEDFFLWYMRFRLRRRNGTDSAGSGTTMGRNLRRRRRSRSLAPAVLTPLRGCGPSSEIRWGRCSTAVQGFRKLPPNREDQQLLPAVAAAKLRQLATAEQQQRTRTKMKMTTRKTMKKCLTESGRVLIRNLRPSKI